MNINLSEVPAVIRDSLEFESLSDAEADAFKVRLNRAVDLATTLASGVRLSNADGFLDFVEDLQLDLASAQEIPGESGVILSRWILHYSWSFESSPRLMHDSLPFGLLKSLDFQEPSIEAPVEQYLSWFKEAGLNLLSALASFSGARTFHDALGSYIVADVILARLLLACFKLRLHASFNR